MRHRRGTQPEAIQIRKPQRLFPDRHGRQGGLAMTAMGVMPSGGLYYARREYSPGGGVHDGDFGAAISKTARAP